MAHNCVFDATRFTLAIQQLHLKSELEKSVAGFTDTLKFFKKKFPKRENGHTLTSLASELLSLSCENAHDAKFDVDLLEQLAIQFIDVNYLINNKVTISAVETILNKYFASQENLPGYAPMKLLLKHEMLKRLSEHVAYDKLVETYKSRGIEETKALLKGELNGKAQVIKSPAIMNVILNYSSSV